MDRGQPGEYSIHDFYAKNIELIHEIMENDYILKMSIKHAELRGVIEVVKIEDLNCDFIVENRDGKRIPNSFDVIKMMDAKLITPFVDIPRKQKVE